MSSQPAAPIGFWERLRRLVSPAASARAADPARLSFLLQQQEGELQRLRRLVSDAQVSLKKAEQERQKWNDSLNEREVQIENERSRATRTGAVARDLDGELRKLRRDKVEQQRSYEDRIHDLIERLGDLQKGYPAASQVVDAADRTKSLAMEKEALRQDLHETQDKIMLLEGKLDAERDGRLELQKQISALKTVQAELQEKLRNTESSLWNEKLRTTALESDKKALKDRLLEEEAVRNERDNSAQDPFAMSPDVIRLRERVHELEDALRGQGREVPEERIDAAQEASAAARVLEDERSRWNEEKLAFRRQTDEEKARSEKEAALRKIAEERAAGLTEELDRERSAREDSKKEWERERRRLAEAGEQEKELRVKELSLHKSTEDRAADLLAELEKTRALLEEARAERGRQAEAPPAAGAPPAEEIKTASGVVVTAEDVERMLGELDSLLAENAFLNDQLRFLQEGEGGGGPRA